MCNNLSHQEKKTAKCLSTDSFTKQHWLLSGKQLSVNRGEALRKGKSYWSCEYQPAAGATEKGGSQKQTNKNYK